MSARSDINSSILKDFIESIAVAHSEDREYVVLTTTMMLRVLSHMDPESIRRLRETEPPASSDALEFGTWLRRSRKAMGHTVVTFAAVCTANSIPMTHGDVSNMERGKGVFSVEKKEKIKALVLSGTASAGTSSAVP